MNPDPDTPQKGKPMPEETTPHPRDEEPKPVVWTPEDASRFLTAAIHEAQLPLAEALKQRPVTAKGLAFIIAGLALAAAVIGLILSSQLEKQEKLTAEARQSRDAILVDKAELQAKASITEERLRSANSTISGLRDNAGELRQARAELQRSRRQNELLRNQISGLEMEKTALARQLEAVKALAFDDAGDGEGLDDRDGAPPEEETKTATPTAEGGSREDAATALSPGPGFRPSPKAVTPEGAAPWTPSPAGQGTLTVKPVESSQPSETAEATPPAVADGDTTPAAASPDQTPGSEPVAPADTPPPAEAAADGEPPLTLFEKSQLLDADAEANGEGDARLASLIEPEAAAEDATDQAPAAPAETAPDSDADTRETEPEAGDEGATEKAADEDAAEAAAI